MIASLTTLLIRAAWIACATASVAGLVLLVRVVLVRFTGWRPQESSLPLNAPRATSWCRGMEAVVVLLMGVAVIGSSVLNVWWYGVDLDLIPETQRRQEFFLLGLLTVAVGVTSVAAIWRTSVAIMAAVVLLSAHLSLLDQGTIGRHVASETDIASCAIEIQLEGTTGAEVWANGVHLGRTPLTVSLSDWMKLPRWLDAPTEGPEGSAADTTAKETPSRGSKQSGNRPRWIPCVVKPAGTSVSTRLPDGTYFLWVEVGGDPIVGASASGTNLKFDGMQWVTTPILISGRSKSWDKSLDRFWNQARARDYRIDSAAEWLAAMNSFGDFAWGIARARLEEERLLGEWLDHLLRADLGLSSAPTSAEAWAAFEKLEQQVTNAREYRTDSQIGWSLDLLLPHLDPEQLARHAVGMIKSLRWCPSSGSWEIHYAMHENRSGHEHAEFGLKRASVDVTHYRRRDQLARLGFLAHAVWQMDERLDTKSNDRHEDNTIERIVVPALWRRSWQFEEAKQWVRRLGGTMENRLIERQIEHWRQRRLYLDPTFASWPWPISQRDQSDAAHRWRHEHADEILAIADRLSLIEGQRTLQPFELLFSDANVTADSVAARYWPRFRDRVVATSWAPKQKVETLWEYLFQLEPFTTAEMYAEAWRLSEVDWLVANELQLSESVRLHRAAPEKRRAIVTAITSEVESRLKAAREGGSARRVAELEETLRQIPQLQQRYFESLAERQLRNFRHHPEQESMFDVMAYWLTMSIPVCSEIRDMLGSPDAKQRLLGVRVIATHPAPHIRPLLGPLLEDSDPAVRTLAQETDSLWQQLATDRPTGFQRETSP